MKNKRGNVAVIAIIIVIIAITAGVVGWMFAKKSQKPVQQVDIFQSAPIAQLQPTEPITQESPTQIMQTPSDNQSSFKFDEKGGFYGAVVVTGYPVVESRLESFCEENCKKYSYVFFQVLNADNVALFDFIEEKKGNSFVGDKQIGLGCLQNKIITYSNDSDKIGMKKHTLSADLSKKIMESSREKPVTIKLEKLLLTSGRGAPDCYSHFTYVSDLK